MIQGRVANAAGCIRIYSFLGYRDARSKKENGAKESSEGSVAM
jgi:hypothetical protein